jgi:two-component system chemotaxis response regulator CheB
VDAGIVVIGASWGGLQALSVLLDGVPAAFDVPMVIVQHRGKDAESLLPVLLQDHTRLVVSEVDDKQPIERGHVYIAPPDYHLLVEGKEFSLTTDAPVRFSRPSIDVTFVSAADACGPLAIGVVLTGANEDGANGLRRIVDMGGHAIVQDPATAEVKTMPAAALRVVPSAESLPLHRIGPRLSELVTAPVRARTVRRG